jgi:hypothetical protein
MVITAKILQDRFGIDEQIATYFANERPVPANNRFWETKRIYISRGFGFLIIPLAYDLMYKAGIPKDQLLSDEHVTLMEQGIDSIERYEKKEISIQDFLMRCRELLNGKIKQPHLAADLMAVISQQPPSYFKFETKYKALARGDGFLFTLVDLELNDEWVASFLPYWYSLARPIFLLDDFMDLEEDRKTMDENIIIELGNNAEGIRRAYELGLKDIALLGTRNSKLSTHMKQLFNDSLEFPYIKKELN